MNELINRELIERCPLLTQYAMYVGRVQGYAQELPLEEAVERAVHECIREGVLSDFLRKNRAEAIEVSIFEYDEEKELALFREAEREVGREAGREESRVEGLKALIRTLQAFSTDPNQIYTAIKQNEIYAELTLEEFQSYL